MYSYVCYADHMDWSALKYRRLQLFASLHWCKAWDDMWGEISSSSWGKETYTGSHLIAQNTNRKKRNTKYNQCSARKWEGWEERAMWLLIPASRALCSSTACLTVPYDPTLHARLHSPLCPNVPTVPNTLSSGCHTLLLKRTCYLCSYNAMFWGFMVK